MATETSASKQLQSFFDSLVKRINGLVCVLVSDIDGVVLLKSVSAYQENSVDVELAAVFALCTTQVNKLHGECQSLATWCDDRVIVYINASPVYVSLITNSPDANVGVLLQLEKEINQILAPMKEQLLKFDL